VGLRLARAKILHLLGVSLVLGIFLLWIRSVGGLGRTRLKEIDGGNRTVENTHRARLNALILMPRESLASDSAPIGPV
jgi:hypothetical protein